METVNTNDIVTLASAINEYGVFVVIMAVFLLLFVAIIVLTIKNSNTSQKKIIEDNKNANKALQAQQDVVLKTMLQQQKDMMEIISSSIKPKPYDETDIVKIFVKLNEALKGECKQTQQQISAGRIAIYVFHNGTSSSHGLPFFKMSCVSECIQRGSGFLSEIQNHSNLPLGMFDSIVDKLYNDGQVVITDTESLKYDDPITFAFLSSQKVKSCILLSVYEEKNDKILGFINSEFDFELDDNDVTRIIRVLLELGLTIRPVLQFSEYQNKKQER